MRARELLAATLVCIGWNACMADDPPPPSTKAETWTGLGWIAGLKIIAFPSPHVVANGSTVRISGTNINIEVSATLVNPHPTPGPEPKIRTLELKIGGEAVKTWNHPDTGSHNVRFVSTHFADNFAANVVLKGTFDILVHSDPLQMIEEEFEIILPLTVHNKGLVWATHADDDVLHWPEISGYVHSSRMVPAINMVVMYACSTCASPFAASDAFGITNGGPTIPDRAYAGFADIVWSVLDSQGQRNMLYPLSHHSNLLMAKLSAGGWTIREAIISASERYTPVVDNNPAETVAMQLKGDPFARMIGVYVDNENELEVYRHQWYKTY